MVSKIQFLDEQTINQIAAGEVIENPASVVKELVENSLDAGASKIFVEIQAGGQTLITVEDNGIGMGEEDAKLSIGRHATSKIRIHDDLLHLSTLGFRGEALSSIASISEFSCRTGISQNEDIVKDGTLLQVQGGKIISCEKATTRKGTKIEVRSLFYNVPARKKFQKAPTKDTFEVTKLMTQLALAHPECEFEYVANFKKEFNLKACTFNTLDVRIGELLGQEFASQLKPVYLEKDEITLQGFIGDACGSRPTRAGQYLFINKRPISSLAFSYAIKEGYGTAIDPLRHPSFVLHLTIPSHSVDVNVHPQKKEVRFKREDEMRKLAWQAVDHALFKMAPIAKMTRANMPLRDVSPSEFAAFVPELNVAKPYTSSKYSFDLSHSVVEDKKPIIEAENFFQPSLSAPTTQVHVLGVFQEYALLDIQWDDGVAVPEKLKSSKLGLIIADCKAVLSRIAFEDLTEKKLQENEAFSSPSSQKLLVPHFVEFSQGEANFLLKILPYLKNLGLEMREFGSNAFLIEALPATLEVAQVEDFIRGIVSSDAEFCLSLDPAKERRRFAQIAARFSANRKYPLSSELAKEIIKRLLLCREPFSCPFGNACFAVITKDEIQKRFT